MRCLRDPKPAIISLPNHPLPPVCQTPLNLTYVGSKLQDFLSHQDWGKTIVVAQAEERLSHGIVAAWLRVRSWIRMLGLHFCGDGNMTHVYESSHVTLSGTVAEDYMRTIHKDEPKTQSCKDVRNCCP